MSNTITISRSQIDRLEHEIYSMKAMLSRIMDQLQSPGVKETFRSRKEVVAMMDTAAQRANLAHVQ
jgi:hypothetical protein